VGVRVSRLAEAVAVLKGCFGDGPFSFSGAHYTVTAHDGLPKPVQRPYPPIFIGGGGRRILTLAGREADIVGLAPRTLAAGEGPTVRSDPRSITIAATQEKIGWIREAAGERFDRLELNCYPTGTGPILTDHARKTAADVLDGIRARTGVEVTVDEFLSRPTCSSARRGWLRPGLRERLGISSFHRGRGPPCRSSGSWRHVSRPGAAGDGRAGRRDDPARPQAGRRPASEHPSMGGPRAEVPPRSRNRRARTPGAPLPRARVARERRSAFCAGTSSRSTSARSSPRLAAGSAWRPPCGRPSVSPVASSSIAPRTASRERHQVRPARVG
jgi:hypothetical protein